MSIKLDNKKPKFYLENWKTFFESKGYRVPESEIEFRQVMMNKNLTIMYVSDAIKSQTGWDNDDLDEECPDKAQKVDKFLELYDVIYPNSQPQPDDIYQNGQEEPTQKFDMDGTGDVSPVSPAPPVPEISDESPMTLGEAGVFLLEHYTGLKKDTDGNIRLTAPTMYENKSITVNSSFRVQYQYENISRNNVLILNRELDAVVAVGQIVFKEDRNLVLADRQNIDFEAFEKQTQFHFALLEVAEGSFTGNIFYKPMTIQMHKMQTTDRVLCIDFGTSNTMAGSYRIKDEFGFEPELVTFADVMQENRLVSYFPTVVCVRNCLDENHIVYQFGFEARKFEKTSNYETSASVFYQIKQWLIEDSDYDPSIEISDPEGNRTRVLKTEIVCQYLKHVIALAEDYFGVVFKTLHFTAPVKMKQKFIHILKALLPEYQIIEDAVDEAGAILFDYVADKFRNWNQQSSFSGNVAVMDCGGGTTDLATCEYTFSDKGDNSGIKKIQIETRFTNGDFNFGGNNITYKLMQLIKLKTAVKFGFIQEEDYNKVFERSENEILLDADDNHYDNTLLYQDFNALYDSCEAFIPTRFNASSEEFYDDDIPKIKRNFYYLWHFAEQVKIIFYREEKVVLKADWDEAIAQISDIKLNYLYRKNGDFLEKLESPLDNLKISITEIRKIIFGDIYNLLTQVLPKTEYDYYRLSGQSCKINLFNELLKEFIPGRKLRAKMVRNPERIESISLKKHCIEGSIRYIMYKRLNMRTEVEHIPVTANRIYQVSFADLVSDSMPMEKLSKKDTPILCFYTVKPELDEVTAVVSNQNGIIRKLNISARIQKGNASGRQYTNPTAVIEMLKNGNTDIDWETTRDNLANIRLNSPNGKIILIVAVPAGTEEGYGFYVHFIYKVFTNSEEQYYVTDGKYYNYESTGSDFFNGMR